MDTGLDIFLSQIGMDGWDGKSQFPSPDSQGLLANVDGENSKFSLPDFDADIEALFNALNPAESDEFLDFACGLDAPFIHEDLLYQGPQHIQLPPLVNQLPSDENGVARGSLFDYMTPMILENEFFAGLFSRGDVLPQSVPRIPNYVAFPVVSQETVSLSGILSDEDQTLEQIKAYLMNYAESGMEVDPVPLALEVPSATVFAVPHAPAPPIIPVEVTTIKPKPTRRTVTTAKPAAPRNKKSPAVPRAKKPRPSKKMTDRKRGQNKKAATRYRSKKRQLEDEAMEVHQALLQEKERIAAVQSELKMKLEYAIRLMEGKLKKAKR